MLRESCRTPGACGEARWLLYCSGVLSLYLVAGTPVHDISEQYLLTAHMFQHTVFVMVSAPLLLAGMPAWLWQAILRQPGSAAESAEVLTHPAGRVRLLQRAARS